jgi:hypothetical protein
MVEKFLYIHLMTNLIVYHLVKPLKPYWLYLRFRLFKLLSEFRKEALVKKYAAMSKRKEWNDEKWIIVS